MWCLIFLCGTDSSKLLTLSNTLPGLDISKVLTLQRFRHVSKALALLLAQKAQWRWAKDHSKFQVLLYTYKHIIKIFNWKYIIIIIIDS